jgi:hypothetical protein
MEFRKALAALTLMAGLLTVAANAKTVVDGDTINSRG